MTIPIIRSEPARGWIAVAVIAAALAIPACGRNALSSDVAKRVTEVLDQIVSAGLSAEAITGTYSTVWSKAIEEREDFNVALAAHRDSEAVKAARSKLTQELKEVQTKIRSLGAEGLADEPLFEQIADTYAMLARLAALAETPSGNLQSFNQNAAGLESELRGAIARSRLFLPPEPPAK